MFVAFKNLSDKYAGGVSAFFRADARRLAPLDCAAVWLVLTAAVVLASPAQTGTSAQRATHSIAASEFASADHHTGTWVPTQDSWNDQLRNPSFWAERRSGKSSVSTGWSAPNGLGRAQPNFLPPVPGGASFPGQSRDGQLLNDRDTGAKGGKTYRTMCVRLCDGFFFPISFATTKDNFERDAATCERNCGGATDARLFVYRNPGGEIEEMEDLDGKPYKKLQTAFLFRAKYEPSCKCRAHPWEEASQTRHRTYALNVAAQKGDTAAARELGAIKAKMLDDARVAARDKQALAKLKREAVLEEKAAARAAKRGNKTAKLEDRRAALPHSPQPTATNVDLGSQRLSSENPATIVRRLSDGRAGAIADPAATPAGGRTGIVILRFGSRAPVEVNVPTYRSTATPVPRRRDADARPFPGLPQQQ